jgi:hypothetical protein
MERGSLPMATICAAFSDSIRFKFSAAANFCRTVRYVPTNGLGLKENRCVVASGRRDDQQAGDPGHEVRLFAKV